MTNSQPQVAIVVVSYNTRALLLECLASVFETANEEMIDVVVVDNASEDGSDEAVRNAFPQVTAITNAKNVGFGAACNQAIQATSAPLVLLLNSDARLTPVAFQVLYDCLERNERCGAAGCYLTDSDGARLTNTRNFLTPLNQALETAGLTLGSRSLQRSYRPNLHEQQTDSSVDWIGGACLMLRRAALDEVGLFDERFFMYSEDEDLCFRLRRAGWLVCFCGQGTAFHYGGASTRQSGAEMLRHFYRSQLLFLSKHHNRRWASFHAVVMKTVLFLKRSLLRDGSRREQAREELAALKEAYAAWRSEA